MEIECVFIFPEVAGERAGGIPPPRPCPRAGPGLAPQEEMEGCQCVRCVGFLWLGMPPPSAVRAARLVQRGIMSQHNLPPAEKRHVLPRGEKESILLSSINLELALFFSLYHFSLPTTISAHALLHLRDHCIQPAMPIKWLRRSNGLAPRCPCLAVPRVWEEGEGTGSVPFLEQR